MELDTGKMSVINTVMQNPWFAPAGAALVAYLILGMFEESFGISKPIRIALAIAVGFVYKNYGAAMMAYITSLFAFFGLTVL